MRCLQTRKTPWQKEDGVEEREKREKKAEGEKEAADFAFRPRSN